MTGPAETIFAPATAPGRAGLAVIRLSGPQTAAALVALAGPLPAPRRASLRNITDPAGGERIDQGLILWFPGPASFTGEDVAELHLHGGRAVAAAAVKALAALPGLRLAEPGEFARRAFLSGRLDLDAAEGLADLIAAETEAQRRQAVRQLDGALGRRCDAWRERISAATARLEASIDFADEELPDDLERGARAEMAALGNEIAAAVTQGARTQRLRDGLMVAIVGAPNVGKSSLLNALAGRDAAIVSDRAGTTRDVVEVRLDLGGWPVLLADTAGLRDSDCPIESEGVRRSLAAADQADLVLRVYDGSRPDTLAEAPPAPGRELIVANKADLAPHPAVGIAICCRDGSGVAALEAALTEAAAERLSVGEEGGVTRARHAAILSEAAAHLARGATAPAAELAAEDARLALRAVGRIAGRVDVEDLLDRIFGEFCIGK